MKIEETELQKIIQEEATRLKKRMMLESERNKIVKELQEMEALETGEMEEGIGDFFKKAMGQLKQWKLDGSYFNKASAEAKQYVERHPAAKSVIKAIMNKGANEVQAKEAAMHIVDWGGKPDWSVATFDPNTLVFSLEPPKGNLKPSE